MILEVFSCSGGMAEGLRRAGLAPDMAVDWDPDACDSYAGNLGHRPIQMDARDLLRMARAGWSPGPIDLLVMDPPCTPWSRAGKRRRTADERDMIEVAVDLVRVLRPAAYLIANVPGLDDAPNWPVVQRTIGSLHRDGYCVVDFARLDAADYGVPQRRVRPFWFGHGGGPCIVWPEPTHGDPAVVAAEARQRSLAPRQLRSWVTCREALGHLPREEIGRPVRLRWRNARQRHPPSRLDEPAHTMTTRYTVGSGAMTLALSGVLPRSRKRGSKAPRASHIDDPARVVTCGDNLGGGNTIFDGPNHRPSRPDGCARTLTRDTHGDGALLAWPWDRPATVVHADDRIAPPGHHEDHAGRSMPNAIAVSERAAAILQGFPDGWTFAGETKRARWSQIGQAMPPPLAEAVGRAIARQMRAAATRAAE